MRVLITGISGFIGVHLARYLSERRGFEVVGLSNSPPSEETPWPTRSVDVANRGEVKRAVDEIAPDTIVHLAGLAHVGASWQRPGDYLRVNFEGTRNVLEAAAGRRLIFASSAEVYGAVAEDRQPIHESEPVAPRSPYAMTKACAEVLALDAGALVARSFNSIGPGQMRQFALASFAWQLAEIQQGRQEPVLKVGDLSPIRDFVPIVDTVRAYDFLLEAGQAGEVYNLATGHGTSIGQALEKLCEIAQVPAEIRQEESRMRKVDIPLLVGDASKLRALGWSCQQTLEDALAALWAWTQVQVAAA